MPTSETVKNLRERAIAASLFRPGTLRKAVDRLGFVQADPIRSPARAQDLILRHRVKDYRLGDIEQQYHRLQLEEDRLHVYGFMPRSTLHLLHPRTERRLSSTERRVLDVVATHKRIHPADLEAYFGRKVVRSGWGAMSKETTQILQSLHHRGFLRVAGRENGIRVYEPAAQKGDQFSQAHRFHHLVLLIASILGPISDSSLRSTLGYLAYGSPMLKGVRSLVPKLIQSEELASALVDGVRYLWPAGRAIRYPPSETVRFLTPFDPLVWDRQRFEHFWGWQYRFEAYVPAAKRQLGYYAMPILWRDDIIGWVNVRSEGGKVIVEPGFKKARPTELAFETEFDAEVARLQIFLKDRRE